MSDAVVLTVKCEAGVMTLVDQDGRQVANVINIKTEQMAGGTIYVCVEFLDKLILGDDGGC